MDIKAELEAAISRIHAKEMADDTSETKKPEEVDFKVGDKVRVVRKWTREECDRSDPTNNGWSDSHNEVHVGDEFVISRKCSSWPLNSFGHPSGSPLPPQVLELCEDQSKPEFEKFRVGDFVEVYKDRDPDYDPTDCGYVDGQKIGDVFKVEETDRAGNCFGHKLGHWVPPHILKLSKRTENECPHGHKSPRDFHECDECEECDRANECEDEAIEEYDGCPIGNTFGNDFGEDGHCDHCRNKDDCEQKHEDDSDEYKCPKCGHHITTVTVSVLGTRTYSINKCKGGKWEIDSCENEETEDDSDYSCPECGKDIEDWKE